MIKRLLSTRNNIPISITNNAWYKMLDIVKKKKSKNFIFSAKSGGCNGFNYDLKLVEQNTYNEFLLTKIKPTILTNYEINVLIEPLSEFYLIGTTIDYISEDYNNGIYESKFIFIPDKNIATSCGCGISFSPKSL